VEVEWVFHRRNHHRLVFHRRSCHRQLYHHLDGFHHRRLLYDHPNCGVMNCDLLRGVRPHLNPNLLLA
jgi:hypothetical protein